MIIRLFLLLVFLAGGAGGFYVWREYQEEEQRPRGPRKVVILVPGICSEPREVGGSRLPDFDPAVSDGGAGVPEHNFGEIRRWLVRELGYFDLPDREDGTIAQDGAGRRDEIVYFSYGEGNSTPYTNQNTTRSIDGEAGSGQRLRDFVRKAAPGPGQQVDIIAHSQGGVVALWSVLDPETARRVHSIVTIQSPVRGVHPLLWGLLFLKLGVERLGFEAGCADPLSESVLDLLPASIEEYPDYIASRIPASVAPYLTSGVIAQINARDWAATPRGEGPYVVNVSSRSDPLVGSPQGSFGSFEALLGILSACCGERGFLDRVHLRVPADPQANPYDAGGSFSSAHQRPLDVLSNSRARPTREAIRQALAS